MPKSELNASIHNRFDIEVRDVKSGKLKQKAEAYNVICNNLWNRLLNVNNNVWYPLGYNHRIGFGNGTGTPSQSDTSLFNYVGHKSGTVSQDLSRFYQGIFILKRSIVLEASEYVGYNFTEVGLMYNSNPLGLATHALIKDLNGNVISINKTSTDVITIVSSIYVHFNQPWVSDSIYLDQNIFINPDSDTPNTGFYDRGIHPFFRALCGDLESSQTIGGFGWRTISSRIRTTDKEEDTEKFISESSIGSGSTSVNVQNKQIIINLERFQASQQNDVIHRYYTIHIQYRNAGYTYGYPLFILFSNGWYTPSLISGEAIGTGNGVNTGFSTKFPIKSINNVYIDGIQENNYSYHCGPIKAELMTEYLSWCTKKNNKMFYYTKDGKTIRQYNHRITDYNIAPVGSMTVPLENPFYSNYGIKILKIFSGDYYSNSGGVVHLLASDDLETWIESDDINVYKREENLTTFQLPANFKNKRFYKLKTISCDSSNFRIIFWFIGDSTDDNNNIVFQTPPSVGSVITIDYTPDCIAKDENHVFDLSMTITLNEHQV